MEVTVSTTSRKASSSIRGIHLGLFTLCLQFLSTSAMAEAEFTAGVELGVSRTDNVFLSEPPDEIDDTVLQASPFVEWTYGSTALDAALSYRYDHFDYRDTDVDQSFQFWNASVVAKALEESLRLEVGTLRRQVLASPDRDLLPGRLPLSGNLTDLDQWWVAPRLTRSLGGSVTLDMSYRYIESEYEDGTQRKDETQQGQFQLENYEAGQGFTWALRYDYRKTDYETSLPFEYQNASAELGLWISANTRVFAAGGLESQWDDLVDRSPEDPYWEAGFAHQVGDRISAEFAAGERSFGSSWRGSLTYGFRRGSMSLSYTEEPTTEGINRRREINLIDPEDPDDFLTVPGDAERYISNRLNWNLNLEGRRTGLQLIAFFEDRSGRFSADGTELEDQDQQGFSIRGTWEAGPRTTFVLDGITIRRRLGRAGEDDVLRLGAAVNYQLGSRTTMSLSHRYTSQDPGDTETSRDFAANVTSLFVTFTL